MSNRTKLDLERALKNQLLKKPFNKITIQDLTDECHISRMSFYYHFKDLQDLVEWACIEDATDALQNKKSADNWQEGLLQIFEAVYENKPFIMNAYHNMPREQIESFLFKLVFDLILHVVEEKTESSSLKEEQIDFIAKFYQYGFVGSMLDWIKEGMHEDYHLVVQNIIKTVNGTLDVSIHNFTKQGL